MFAERSIYHICFLFSKIAEAIDNIHVCLLVPLSTYTIVFSPIFIISDNERDHGLWQAHTNLKSTFRCSQLRTTHIYQLRNSARTFRCYVLLTMCWGQNPKAYQSLNMMFVIFWFLLVLLLEQKTQFCVGCAYRCEVPDEEIIQHGKNWMTKEMMFAFEEYAERSTNLTVCI